jgi:hypothetical protein
VEADAFWRSSFDTKHLGAEHHFDVFGGEKPSDVFRDVRVLPNEELESVRNDGRATSEAPVRLREFETYIPAAENDEMLRQSVELEQLDVRHRAGIHESDDRWNRRVGPEVQEDTVADHHARAAVVQVHLEGLRPTKHLAPMISSAPLAL